MEKNEYKVADQENVRRAKQDLSEALAGGDEAAVRKALENPEKINALVMQIGQAGGNLKSLEQAFNKLLVTRFGVGMELAELAPEKGPELLSFLREMGLQEQILTEMSQCAFHSNQEDKFFKIIRLIYVNQEYFQNQQVVARAIHDMASWQGSHHNQDEAVRGNQKALGMARETDDQILVVKAQAGLSINKKLLPRLKADDLIKLADVLEGKGVNQDAIRLRVEAASALLELAKRQKTGSLHEENLTMAKVLSLGGLKEAINIDYPKAEILAREVLADIYDELDNKRQSDSFRKSATEREEFIRGV